MDHGGIQQSPLLQIYDQGRRRLVHVLAGGRETCQDAGMVVPGLIAGEKADKADAALHETPGDEAARSEFLAFRTIQTIQFLCCFRFLAEIESFLGGRLHPRCEFEALDPGIEVGFPGAFLTVFLIEAFHKCQVTLLGLPLE